MYLLIIKEDSIFNIKNILHNHNIHSTTIQPEFEPKCNEPKCNKECLKIDAVILTKV